VFVWRVKVEVEAAHLSLSNEILPNGASHADPGRSVARTLATSC